MKKLWFLLLTVFLGFSVVGILYFRRETFQVIHPQRGDITEAVYGLGKVKSDERFEVISALISSVTKRYVNEGDQVEKGQALIELDHHALFRAPFRGTVTFANRFTGEIAVPNLVILRIENLQKRFIELSLEQQAILRVNPDQKARVSFEALRGKILDGKVISIFPRDEEFFAKIAVEGLATNILPGMTADVTIEVGHIKGAILIPVRAITNGFVSVRRNNRWEKIKLDLGYIDGLSAEVKGNALTLEDTIRFEKVP